MEPLSATLITWAIYLAPLAGTAIATGFLGKTGENQGNRIWSCSKPVEKSNNK